MSREAMKQALEALESKCTVNCGAWRVQQDQAIAALRQALETEQEPVAHVYLFEPNGRPRVGWDNAKGIKVGDKLYTAPPKHEWVGTTDEEKIELWNKHESHWRFDDGLMAFTRAIEAKLKEKNT